MWHCSLGDEPIFFLLVAIGTVGIRASTVEQESSGICSRLQVCCLPLQFIHLADEATSALHCTVLCLLLYDPEVAKKKWVTPIEFLMEERLDLYLEIKRDKQKPASFVLSQEVSDFSKICLDGGHYCLNFEILQARRGVPNLANSHPYPTFCR